MTEPEELREHLGQVLGGKAFALADRMTGTTVSREPVEYNGDEFADLMAVGADGLDRMREARWTATMPSRFLWADLEDLAPPAQEHAIHDALVDWSLAPAGRNLVLFGPVGVGKTHAAVAACRRSFDHGLDVDYQAATSMFDALRPGGDPELLDYLIDVDLLIIDDLGSERATDWTIDRLYAITDGRWRGERATVVTTNLAPEALEDRIGERMFSRLVGSGATNVRLTGHDRRRKATT